MEMGFMIIAYLVGCATIGVLVGIGLAKFAIAIQKKNKLSTAVEAREICEGICGLYLSDSKKLQELWEILDNEVAANAGMQRKGNSTKRTTTGSVSTGD